VLFRYVSAVEVSGHNVSDLLVCSIVCCFIGLPNTFGEYDETPEYTGQMLQVSQQ